MFTYIYTYTHTNEMKCKFNTFHEDDVRYRIIKIARINALCRKKEEWKSE